MIIVKSKGHFYSKAIILIQCTLAHMTMMMKMLPSEDRRAESLVNLQLAKQTAL